MEGEFDGHDEVLVNIEFELVSSGLVGGRERDTHLSCHHLFIILRFDRNLVIYYLTIPRRSIICFTPNYSQ